MAEPDYKKIATRAVNLLCQVGFSGLSPCKRQQLWQVALDLDRELHPHRPRVTVWTPEEGDVHPPRREDGPTVPGAEGSLTASALLAAMNTPQDSDPGPAR